MNTKLERLELLSPNEYVPIIFVEQARVFGRKEISRHADLLLTALYVRF